VRVLVLGHKGMLGNAVHKYLLNNSVEVKTTDLRWPSLEFKRFTQQCNCNFIVNCIGSIPQRKNNFDINHDLPIWLETETISKIIHPGTDCEIDSDDYGLSKRRAFEFIESRGNKTKIIKTSIIGHEIESKASLLEWFLSQSGSVDGYVNHLWNGNTTLEWSKYCFKMMFNWENFEKINILSSPIVSKYDLLKTISEVYDGTAMVKPHVHHDKVDYKCLNGKVNLPHIKQQLHELKKFYCK
tara:strand:- start:40 stop:762 length:723 start_codon:yes stop_codon:yes gene_type:complete